jgi:hypothetical protein
MTLKAITEIILPVKPIIGNVTDLRRTLVTATTINL